MAQADLATRNPVPFSTEVPRCKAAAAGLFGYSISGGQMRSALPLSGYIREIEQLPNFSPPSTDRFVAHYIRNNIQTRSDDC